MDVTKTLKGVLIYDLEGSRMFSKIFDQDLVGTKQYEKKLLAKSRSQRLKDDLMILDNTLVTHKFVNELHFYVIGCHNENPLILDSVLECMVGVVSTLLKTVEKSSFQKKLPQIVLAFDEICDNGIIMETDSNLVLQRVCLKEDITEQTMTQRLQSATEQFKFPWIRSYT